ncbi:hypothetical protein TWF730_009273 [Orbilia blumenaviensis]|uniref:Uncharacterized protein n=1 Tax=Orbilia blumenaviensis TaxID=1796055 RepID=A0AAV9UXU3_9PEZI
MPPIFQPELPPPPLLCTPLPSRIPRPRGKSTLQALNLGICGLSLSSPLTPTPTLKSRAEDHSDLASNLRAKLHAISPRQPINSPTLSRGVSGLFSQAIEDTAFGESFKLPNATPTQESQDQDFHSQSATLFEDDSPRPPSVAVSHGEPPLVERVLKSPLRRKRLLRHLFRVGKLRSFSKFKRIERRSTIRMLQMSPGIIVLDFLIQSQRMAVKFAVREEVFAAVNMQSRKEKEEAIAKSNIERKIGEKVRRATNMAANTTTDHGSKILALEDILNEVETHGGKLGTRLLDEIQDVSAVYGNLLGVDEVDMEVILARNALQEVDDPEDDWMFAEERACLGESWHMTAFG